VISIMELKDIQANWDQFGKTDPFWAILTDPAKRGGQWGPTEFFETGRKEIAEVMAYVQSLPIELKRGRALDFGCGAGRLTQALCDYFTECHGVDIAPSMIELANRYNRYSDKCQYHLNDRSDLALFGNDEFDFIYSNIVLQHMRPEYSASYLIEFLRLLRPGGLLVFQLPSEPNVSDQMPGLSATVQPLPDKGFKAQISFNAVPQALTAGTQTVISARVKNISDVAWSAAWRPNGYCRIQLGNHWLDRYGRMVASDDGRTPLPHELRPQEEVVLSLPVCTPQNDGIYLLELDMVQEHVAWFEAKGSQTARVRVQVGAKPPNLIARLRNGLLKNKQLAQSIDRVSKPVMEMHGIPKTRVVELLQSARGHVVEVQRFDYAGPEWISYRYFVTRRS
jgi:SAM-dependent methyltransferase